MHPSDIYLNLYLQDNYDKETIVQLQKIPTGTLAKQIQSTDFAFFCKYYLPHYFNKPYSPMHLELTTKIEALPQKIEGEKIALASPRGSAKSTVASTAQILWNICNSYKKYILLIKDTYEQASLDLLGIKEELEENPIIHRDFGDLVGNPWGKDQIVSSNDIMVQALGSGMKIRGRRYREKRPDLVILDDIENDENTNTPEQRNKLENWFNKAVMKVGTPETDFFYIGTILHYDSLLSKILVRAGWKGTKYQAVISWATDQMLWDSWREIYTNIDDKEHIEKADKFYLENEEDLLKGVHVQWPEGQSYYYLMKTLVDEGRGSFDSEYQNEPISLEDALFKLIYYYKLQEKPVEEPVPDGPSHEMWIVPQELGSPVRLADCKLFGSCDPSLGKTKTSDYSAILVGAVSPSNRLFILESDIMRRPPNMIINDIFKYVHKYEALNMRFDKFVVESIAFQEFFKDQVAEESMKAGLFLNVVETKCGGRNKELRIEGLEPDITNGYIMLHANHTRLVNQLRYFPKADHDDGPDALEMLRDLSRAPQFLCEGLDTSLF